MNTFLFKIVKFFITLLVIIVLFIFSTHYTVKHFSDFKLKKNETSIILGHSHPESGFNDNLITNVRNLSSSGEAYIYTYYKLKQICSQNKIKTVFIEFSNNVIEKKMDEWIFGYDKMNHFFYRHSPFMDKSDLSFLFRQNREDFIKVIATSLRKNFVKIILFNFSIDKDYGGYVPSEKSLSNDLLNISSPLVNKGISKYNIEYLKKIVKYCSNNGIQIYFVRTPKHKLYPQTNENELLGIKQKYFKDIEFLDFNQFPLENEQYKDFAHLNSSGSEKFSNWFNILLENNLLSSPNKKQLVENEINKLNILRNPKP